MFFWIWGWLGLDGMLEGGLKRRKMCVIGTRNNCCMGGRNWPCLYLRLISLPVWTSRKPPPSRFFYLSCDSDSYLGEVSMQDYLLPGLSTALAREGVSELSATHPYQCVGNNLRLTPLPAAHDFFSHTNQPDNTDPGALCYLLHHHSLSHLCLTVCQFFF